MVTRAFCIEEVKKPRRGLHAFVRSRLGPQQLYNRWTGAEHCSRKYHDTQKSFPKELTCLNHGFVKGSSSNVKVQLLCLAYTYTYIHTHTLYKNVSYTKSRRSISIKPFETPFESRCLSCAFQAILRDQRDMQLEIRTEPSIPQLWMMTKRMETCHEQNHCT